MKHSSTALAAMVLAAFGCGGRIDTEIATLGDAGSKHDGDPNDGAPPPFDQCGPRGPEVVETALPDNVMWWNADVVHVVSKHLEGTTGLHIAPCTVVRFGPEGDLWVRGVDAAGTVGHPVTFETTSLSKHVASLYVTGITANIPAILNVVQFRNVSFHASGTAIVRGVRFAGPLAGAWFDGLVDPSSTEMVWEDTKVGVAPVVYGGRDVVDQVDRSPPVRFPAGHDNLIGVDGRMTFTYSSAPRRLRNRGYGYRWVNIDWDKPQLSSPSSLAVDPGVTIEFDPNTGIDVGNGGLHIEGTADKPVVLRGHSGTWLGLRLGKGSSLKHTVIEGAGMPFDVTDRCVPPTEQLLGAIVMTRPLLTASFEDLTLRDLPGSGFVAAYGGAGAAEDFSLGNTFVNVGGCKQIVSRPLDGVCPVPAPCAK